MSGLDELKKSGKRRLAWEEMLFGLTARSEV
jgi:hypothetical protein